MNAPLNETDLLFPANLALLREARRLDDRLEHERAPEGLLEAREGLCLYVLARRAASLGNVVEIGSFKGRSTWYLARALEDARSSFRVVAIDPHLEGTAEAFRANVADSGIAARVDARAALSHEVELDEPIGLLWIDGDHSYAGVRRDFDDWFPRLARGGWVAFHDTVNHWYGPTQLVRELLTRRSDVRSVGVMGMITYARKVAPSSLNRPPALAGRLAFEAVTRLRERHVGRGPQNAVAGER